MGGRRRPRHADRRLDARDARPALLVLGCIDVCLDHPKAPPGETIDTRADELRLGLDKCVASYILPENMVWWRLDAAGRYLECLVREYQNPSDRIDHDKNGNAIDPEDAGNARRSLAAELRPLPALDGDGIDPVQLTTARRSSTACRTRSAACRSCG